MPDQISDTKRQWKTKHLRTVCAFANSYGGRLVIGNADSYAPEEALDLARTISEEVSDALDINPHIRPSESKGRACVIIDVKPSSEPVCVDGKYFRRIGKEDRELTGDDLEKFILLKDRRSRLNLLVPGVSVKDLDKNAVAEFRSAAKISKKTGDSEMLQSLRLTDKGMLRGSALILFYPEPCQFTVAPEIRIGRFSVTGLTDNMDVVSGPVFLQPGKAMKILSKKYLSDGEYPKDAVAEAIMNAVAHKDYTAGEPIQIKVYKNRLVVYNPGGLNRNRRLSDEISKPANPSLADVFARAGMMRLMGTGIPLMNAACAESGTHEISFGVTKDDFSVTFAIVPKKTEEPVEETPPVEAAEPQECVPRFVTASGDLKDRDARTREFRITSLLTAIGGEEVSAKQLMERLEFRHRPTFMSNYLEPAIADGYVERTCEKPTSRNQKYRATEKGLSMIS